MSTLEFGRKERKSTELVDFSDPFDKGCVEHISFDIRKAWFTEDIRIEAFVKFKKGNTSGKQRFEADDFPTLVRKVEQFIAAL